MGKKKRGGKKKNNAGGGGGGGDKAKAGGGGTTPASDGGGGGGGGGSGGSTQPAPSAMVQSHSPMRKMQTDNMMQPMLFGMGSPSPVAAANGITPAIDSDGDGYVDSPQSELDDGVTGEAAEAAPDNESLQSIGCDDTSEGVIENHIAPEAIPGARDKDVEVQPVPAPEEKTDMIPSKEAAAEDRASIGSVAGPKDDAQEGDSSGATSKPKKKKKKIRPKLTPTGSNSNEDIEGELGFGDIVVVQPTKVEDDVKSVAKPDDNKDAPSSEDNCGPNSTDEVVKHSPPSKSAEVVGTASNENDVISSKPESADDVDADDVHDDEKTTPTDEIFSGVRSDSGMYTPQLSLEEVDLDVPDDKEDNASPPPLVRAFNGTPNGISPASHNSLTFNFDDPAESEAFTFLTSSLRETLGEEAQDVSNKTLGRYLRWKPDVKRASERFRAYQMFCNDNSYINDEKPLLLSQDPKLAYLVQSGMVVAPEELMAKDGSAVLIIRGAKCDVSSPHDCNDHDASRAIFYVLRRMMEQNTFDPLKGVTVVLDLVGVARKNVPRRLANLLSKAAGCFPLRVVRVIVISMPWWYPAAGHKKLFSTNMRSRIHFLKDKKALTDYIEKDRLLEEDGGIYNFDLQSWISSSVLQELDHQ